MSNKLLPLLGCLIMSGFVLAQVTASAPVREKVLGKTIDVRGLVTVSNGNEISGVVNEGPVVNLTRYVTSSTGYATLKFENCEVKLKPNESLVVDEDEICDKMILAIVSLGGGGAGETIAMTIAGLLLLPNGSGVIALIGGTPPPGGGQFPDPPSAQ